LIAQSCITPGGSPSDQCHRWPEGEYGEAHVAPHGPGRPRLPDPAGAAALPDLLQRLRQLLGWAGGPQYDTVARRVNAAWRSAGRPDRTSRAQVAALFAPGRSRPDEQLVLAIVAALTDDEGYVAQWRRALRVVRDSIATATFVAGSDRLPEPAPNLTGRAAESDRLATLLAGPDAVPVAVLDGPAGVGKSTLAVSVGHRLLGTGSLDHVLYVNLRGFHADPRQPPADPAAVLDSFLRLLGVDPAQIPRDPPRRVALYRARMQERRALVVLDNAADLEQVCPLLPVGPFCRVLVTARRPLELRGAARLTLGPYEPADALRYLHRAAPPGAVSSDPDTADQLARLVGHLALPLSLVAAQVRARPDLPLGEHLDRLVERQADDPVVAAFEVSYEQLEPADRRLLRMLAIHPGPDLSRNAVAALAGQPAQAATEQLAGLVARGLVRRREPGRYELHDLVRALAAARALTEDTGQLRRDALRRLFDHYLGTTAAAMDAVQPADRARRPALPLELPVELAMRMPPFTDRAGAGGWLAAELPNLLATIEHTARQGWSGHAWRLAGTLWGWLDAHHHHAEALPAIERAVAAAVADGDRPGEARALQQLGMAHDRLGNQHGAVWYLERALAVWAEAGDETGTAATLVALGDALHRQGNSGHAVARYLEALHRFRGIGDERGAGEALFALGRTHRCLTRYETAREYLESALMAARQSGDRPGRAATLRELGEIAAILWRYDQAESWFGQAAQVSREDDDLGGSARALAGLGVALLHQGETERALDGLQRSLGTYRELEDRAGAARALTELGRLSQRAGRLEEAVRRQQQAITLARAAASPGLVARGLNGLAQAYLTRREPDLALAHHRSALAAAQEGGEQWERAAALDGIAQILLAGGRLDQARQHWQECLAVLQALAVPEAVTIQDRLEGLPRG
jgi:tetratricopeptide (TPR) repeat protein